MTAPPVIAVAALLAMLAVAVAFRALGSFGRRGRGLDGGSFRLWVRRLGRGSFQERRSRRGQRWVVGRSRTRRPGSRTRRRRSALLDPFVSLENRPTPARLGGPSGPGNSPGPRRLPGPRRSLDPARSLGATRSLGPTSSLGPTRSAGPTAAIDSNRASGAGAGHSSVPLPGRAPPADVGSGLRAGSGPGLSLDPGSGSSAGPADRPRRPDAPWREGRGERRSVDPFDRVRTRISMPGRAAVRRREMEEAVPEVVDVLRATVAVGINPRRALQAAAEGAPSALSDVLGQAIRAAELGSGAGQALAAAAKAERLSELELAGEALDLAETTGAPPGPVLAGVAIAATDRIRSRQAVLAATAQARLSARVVAAMAPAFLGVLALTAPSDAAFLIREPAGWAALTAATVLELLGICWAARIVRGPAP